MRGGGGGLDVEVHAEFVGVGSGAEGVDFDFLLVSDPAVDDVAGEYVSGEEVVVVGGEGAEGFLEIGGRGGDAGEFAGGEAGDFAVDGVSGVDFVVDAIECGHGDGGEGEIGIRGGVGGAEFEAFGGGIVGVDGDSDGGGAVAGGVDHVGGGFVAGDEAFVGIGGGGADAQREAPCLRMPPMAWRAIWESPAYFFPAKRGLPALKSEKWRCMPEPLSM